MVCWLALARRLGLAWGGIGSVGWGFIVPMCDETLPIINKPKTPKKRGNTKNKKEGPTSKKTKEQPKRTNHKENIEFSNSLLSQQAY
jgi:hypothetical protein